MNHRPTARQPNLLTRFFVVWLGALGVILSAGCGDSSSGSGPHITVKLVADQDSVSPGSAFTLGVQFSPEPGWHIYWKNPGDSGLAPRFTWTAPEDVTIQDPLWPHPERIAVGPLVNYGYGETMIPFPARLKRETSDSSVTITSDLQWLVCKDECLPGEATLRLTLPVSHVPAPPSQHRKAFEKAFHNIPTPLQRVSIAIEEQQDQIVLALIPLEQRYLPTTVTFFPEDPRIISNSAPQVSSRDGDILRIALRRDPMRREPIGRVRGVLISSTGWSNTGEPKAVSIDTNPGEASPVASYSTSAPLPSNTSHHGLPALLLLAFLGGIILNLMPCVFPVLSIKIMSFIEHGTNDPRRAKAHGIAFSIGVLVSFWILAAILVSVRAGGEQLGWGFQLQSPTFVVAMIFVFLVLGLLMLSDVVVGQTLQSIAGRAKLAPTYLGSFLSGVLATAVATPCTAPFMGTALAATVTLPTFSSLMIFTALGLGMSAPYLLLTSWPRLLRLLPRPGAWMENCKQFMAFPLFASVVWLTRVFARQMGMEPPGLTVLIDLLWGILVTAFGLWLLSRVRTIHTSALRVITIGAATASCIAGVLIAIPSEREVDESRIRACVPTDAIVPFTDSFGLLWEQYSEDRLKKILAQGRPVYVDFTAEWCITCQVNERLVFGSQEVRDLISKKNVTLMRADWTSKNPAITAALRRFGRNGVPLNIILAHPAAEPIILPNLLTPGIVVEALQKLPG